jgi:TATA-box binding protein (TBP) (component of TFIID and TFIIIB)
MDWDVNALAAQISKVIYEPDQFPGAIFKTPQGPVCLIFSSGKIVIVGSKSEQQLGICFDNLKKILKDFI